MVGIIIIVPILWMRKLRLLKIKHLAQSHLTGNWQNWELNPGLFDIKAQVFYHSAEVLIRMNYSY